MSERRYFGTDGIRGRAGEHPITAEFALKLGWAVGQVLAQDGKGSVLIGQDPRSSGEMLVSALSAGAMEAGLEVYTLGIIPTPGVAYLTRSLNAQIGIMVSASHNPYYDNGIKFFSAEGKKLPDAIEEKIESYLDKPLTCVESYALGKTHQVLDASGRYIEFCKNSFLKGQDLKGIKIVVDCAHGATHDIAPHVFSELGAEVIAIFNQPDGTNINEGCGSTHPQALQKAVIENQAELGIAFDGDGDRVMFVDHMGELVDGDELLYLISQYYQNQGILQGGVVGTQMSNLGLEQAFNLHQIPFVRSKVGDRYVMDELKQKGWILGGESSGHIICLDKTTTGDGIISALQVLSYLCLKNQSLCDLKKGMNKCAQVLINVRVDKGSKIVQDPKLLEKVSQIEKDLAKKGRILLRPSGTEPLIRVMVEGEDQKLIQQVAEEIANLVKELAKSNNHLV